MYLARVLYTSTIYDILTCNIALLQNRSISLLATRSKSEPVKAALRQDHKLISVHIDPGNTIPDFSYAPEDLLNVDILFQGISVDLSMVCASFIDHEKHPSNTKLTAGIPRIKLTECFESWQSFSQVVSEVKSTENSRLS